MIEEDIDKGNKEKDSSSKGFFHSYKTLGAVIIAAIAVFVFPLNLLLIAAVAAVGIWVGKKALNSRDKHDTSQELNAKEISEAVNEKAKENVQEKAQSLEINKRDNVNIPQYKKKFTESLKKVSIPDNQINR